MSQQPHHWEESETEPINLDMDASPDPDVPDAWDVEPDEYIEPKGVTNPALW